MNEASACSGKTGSFFLILSRVLIVQFLGNSKHALINPSFFFFFHSHLKKEHPQHAMLVKTVFASFNGSFVFRN